MNHPNVFRQTSLNRLSSPDDVDRLLRVTSLRGWLALAGLALLVGTAVVWACVASVPLVVRGQGILLKSGGIFEAVAPAPGRVVDLAVAAGDRVVEGQVVARLAQPELEEKLQSAKIRLANLREQHATLLSQGARQANLEGAYRDQQRRNLDQSIASAESSLTWLRDKAASQQMLVQQGRLTRQTLLNTNQQLDAVNERIRTERVELTELGVRGLQAQAAREREIESSAFAVRQAQTEVTQLERDLRAAAEVRSPFTGRVIEIVVEQGTVLARGQPLFTLDLTGRSVAGLEGILYVSAREGKRVHPGMQVQIAPGVVKPEEHGYLLGKVTSVSEFPSTSRGMLRVLKNEKLIATLSGGGAPHEVHVDLLPDPATVSHFKWSSAKGPPMEIQSGTLCSAGIIVDSRRPIELAMPFLRASGM
jgi:HlyD family secretion protein